MIFQFSDGRKKHDFSYFPPWKMTPEKNTISVSFRRKKKTYSIILIFLPPAPSRGDLTRGVCFRRACQAPTHDDKKKCPGRNEVRK